MNTVATVVPVGRGATGVKAVMPKGLSFLKKLSASQFSRLFKGNLAKLKPKYRGMINIFMNKSIVRLNGQTSSGMILLKAKKLKSEEEK